MLAVARGQAAPWPEPSGRDVGLQVAVSLAAANYLDPVTLQDQTAAPFLASSAPPRAQRPRFSALADDVAFPPFGNQMPQHPPLFYLLAGTLVRLLALERLSWDVVVWLLRLLNVALATPLPLLAFLAARRLLAERVAVAAAVVPLTIPQLAHVGSTVNNDGLLILTFGVLTVLLASVIAGDRDPRTALAVGAVGGLALLTKGFAILIPAWIVMVYAWTAVVTRARAQRALRDGLLALGTAMAVGGWWWVRNLVRYGTVQPGGFPFPYTAPEVVQPRLVTLLEQAVVSLSASYWGVFGWLQLPLPAVLTSVASAVALALVAVGLAARRELILLAVPTLGSLAIVLWGAWEHYRVYDVIRGLQGRYLFAGVVGLAVIVACGADRLLVWGSRGRVPPAGMLPLSLLAAAVALQATGAATLLDGFWSRPAGTGVVEGVRALLAWSPAPLRDIALVASAAVAVCHLAAGAARQK